MSASLVYITTIGLILTINLNLSATIRLTNCEIAEELWKRGVVKQDLPSWVCLAILESGGNTKQVRGPGGDGSMDYGLYQVSDNWWCGHNGEKKQCHASCEEMITDDPGPSIECARKIMNIYGGFNAWHRFASECDTDLPDLTECNIPEYGDSNEIFGD